MDSETTSYAPAGRSLLCSRIQQVIPAAPESGLQLRDRAGPHPAIERSAVTPSRPSRIESIARIKQMLTEQIGYTNRLRVREQQHRGQLLAKLCRSELSVSTTRTPLTPDIRLRFDRCRP